MVGIIFGIITRICTKCKSVISVSLSSEISSSNSNLNRRICCIDSNNIIKINDSDKNYRFHSIDTAENILAYRSDIEKNQNLLAEQIESLNKEIYWIKTEIIKPIELNIDYEKSKLIEYATENNIENESEILLHIQNNHSDYIATINSKIEHFEFQISEHKRIINLIETQILSFNEEMNENELIIARLNQRLHEMFWFTAIWDRCLRYFNLR